MYLFIYLAALGLSCGMWDQVPRLGIEPGSSTESQPLAPQGSPRAAPLGSAPDTQILLKTLLDSACW